MFEVILTKEAQKDYQKLDKTMTRRVNQCLNNLGQNPLQYPQTIPLKGNLAGYYRWRMGDWRVFYQIDPDEQVVIVLQIAHRKQAYC